jgi:hypothetical protein
MPRHLVFVVPALLCSVLAAAPVLAEGPEDDVSLDPTPDPIASVDPVVVVPAPAPIADYPVDDYYVEPTPRYEPHVEPNETPSKETTLKLGSGYIGLGIAPGMTLHPRGFHPNTRFELEFGGTLEHRRRDLALSFGVVTHITGYYERKKASYGADVTMTALLGPVYLRTGLGALGGLPRAHLLHQTTAGVGGVVGVGLSLGRKPMVRVGVDYDLRVNTRLEPVHTFLLALRFACCRSE